MLHIIWKVMKDTLMPKIRRVSKAGGLYLIKQNKRTLFDCFQRRLTSWHPPNNLQTKAIEARKFTST